MPVLMTKPAPQFPPASDNVKTCTVTLELRVDENGKGKVLHQRVKTVPSMRDGEERNAFVEEAKRVAEAIRFQPATTESGRPIAVEIQVEVWFER